MAQTLLNLPVDFSWATNTGKTITPAAASVTPADGWDFSERPPARLMNYIHNIQGSLGQNVIVHAIANISSTLKDWVGGGANGVNNILYNGAAAHRRWVVTEPATNATHVSFDGFTWVAAGAMGAAPVANCSIITDTDGFIVGSAANLYWSDDAAVWTAAGGVGADFIANVGTSDRFMVSKNATLYRWLTGIAGGATAPTTPAGGVFPGNIWGIGGDTANNWALVDVNGDCYTSTDGGDVWTQTAQGPVDAIATFVPVDLDYEDGTIVSVGATGAGVPQIGYSLDDGVTWAAATFGGGGYTTGVFTSVKALGNGRWVAVGSNLARAGATSDYFYSIDDGVTWYPGMYTLGSTATTTLEHVWCNGGRIAAAGGGGSLLFTPLIGLEE